MSDAAPLLDASARLLRAEAAVERAARLLRGEPVDDDPRSRVVRLSDGRDLHAYEYGAAGDDRAPAVLCFPPLSGTHVYGRLFDRAAAAEGLRFFCFDRCGFGLSSAAPPGLSLIHI